MTEKTYPKAVQYMPDIIKVLLTNAGSAKASVVKDAIAEQLTLRGLEVPQEKLKSGAPKFPNDLQWARYYLIKGGWLEPKDNAGYGIWKLTGVGWTTRIDDSVAKDIYDSVTKKSVNNPASEEDVPEQYQIAQTLSWEKQLFDILVHMHEGKFETLCHKIMMESGFEPHGPTTHVNKPDGGIDGEGMLPMGGVLIKVKVAWQCKRFKGKPVTASVIRDFRGSIDGKTQYGIIFTSSTFTSDAKKESQRAGATPIELIDIEKMILMLKEKAMGVTERQVIVCEVDHDYFARIGSAPGTPAASLL